MPFLKEQVDIINAHLKLKGLGDDRFSGGLIVGLAEQANVQDGDNDQIYPIYQDENGKFRDIVTNDSYSLIIYHRQEDSSFEEIQGFGSVNDREREECQMVLIAYGKQDSLKMTKEELASFINLAMPSNIPQSSLSGIKLNSMGVARQGYDVNSLRVFGEEYVGVDFRISPEEYLLKIDYTITTEYRKDCFDLCDC